LFVDCQSHVARVCFLRLSNSLNPIITERRENVRQDRFEQSRALVSRDARLADRVVEHFWLIVRGHDRRAVAFGQLRECVAARAG
jgi:hypothetical protein